DAAGSRAFNVDAPAPRRGIRLHGHSHEDVALGFPRTPMIPSLGRRVAVVALLVLACAAGVMAAQDVVTVGTAVADGPTVDVPVSIQDVSGTPLGMDQPSTSRIQAFSIRVQYAPASAVSSVTFSRSGITARLTPAFETSPASAGAISLLDSFQQSSNPIPFTLN